MELTSEQRQEILDQIHQREFLEKAAVEQERKARQEESELEHRRSLVDAARFADQERRSRLESNLSTSIDLIQKALAAFLSGDERECYRLLAKSDPFIINAKHGVDQKPERPSTGSLPTVKIKADNPQGWAIINAQDLLPVHQVLEDAE